MRRLAWLAITLGLSSLGLVGECKSVPGTSDAATALAFVHGFYPPAADPWDKRKEIFDAGMNALMDEDEKLSGGEDGALDHDPFCDCQDNDGMKVDAITVTSANARLATVVVRLSFGHEKDVVTYFLVTVSGHWRVHDMRENQIPSLRQLFVESNEAARKH